MAGWSILSHGSGLVSQKGGGNCESKLVGCVGVDQKLEGGFDDYEIDEGKVKCLFDQVFSVLTNEAASRGSIRPMPVMLAGGRTLDLFRLFKVVRERGGYIFVSVNDLWPFVAVDLGLNSGLSAPVKLIYHIYLRELEDYFAGKGGRRLGNGGECDSGGNFGLLSLEVEKEFRGLLEYWPNQINKNDRLAMVLWKGNDGVVDMDIEKSDLDLWDVKKYRRAGKYVEKRRRGDDEKLVVYDHSVTKRRSAYLKIQQESSPVMLNWMTQIATFPNDTSIRKATEPSRWKVLMQQAISAREGLLRHPWSNAQRKLKMHPSMYDDDSTDLSIQPTEKLRCSGRLTGVGKSRSCSCCNAGSATECKQLTSRSRTGKRQLETCQKKKTTVTDDSSTVTKKVVPSWNRPHEFDVPVALRFQAFIPEWTGVVVESDSKWLGTQVWPPADGDNSLFEMDSTGRGRSDSCGCPVPGSVNCVRFHIAENRMKVKLEVGKVFFYWRFHHMGEEVSLRWTSKEERKFKDIMIYAPPSKNESFWAELPDCFRKKTRKDLVSYFWNVFVIRRRSYQNRVTPKDIDTDDESEFGSLSERYGEEAVTVPPSSKLLICSENKQCTDFE